MMLKNKTLVVCGAGPGLGSEVARGALRDGANLVLAARTEKKLQALADELQAPDRIAIAVTDIRNEDDCTKLAAVAQDRFGGVDALALVAAVDNTFGNVMDADIESWRNALETNVIGASLAVRALVPQMRSRGGGSIILIGSQSSFVPQMPQIGYASSKGAMITAMYYMAQELGPDRIRVNTVVPTWMWGPPVQAYVKLMSHKEKVSEEEIIAGITKDMPLGEIPKDEDVAEAVLFLASDRARMITGQHLLVNAGEYMP
jgi:NAD(P)-dependent dehydrogenase (short-subunit alcohol dehydrogenase family)